ncbi:MAG: hypothetical protein K8I29_04135 [Alphaproteobacteria bacterium]|uniref:Uncharacterized protein n=1 Tax=Candidatus Nitrobium versatile TaxID=2884831 RepID=A0A953LZC3_9BACT|nr:hypothetical protein [Candidatus Nitrobium versatile]
MKNNRNEIVDITKRIVAARGVPALVLDLKTIRQTELNSVHETLLGKSFDELDVVLQTPGGDIDAAFLIVKILRKQARKVNILVPRFAKSAGTLICLGADAILLTDLSELGPLDTQIYEEVDGGMSGYVSALNGFKALEQVQLHTIETLDIATKLILSRSRMKITEAIHLATEFSGQTSGTLYSMLNPSKIGEYARALEIGEHYGILILTRYMGWPREKAEATVKQLVKQYPSHGFVIDLEELCLLGLPAKEVDAALMDSVSALRKQLLLKSSNSLIELIEPEAAVKHSGQEGRRVRKGRAARKEKRHGRREKEG